MIYIQHGVLQRNLARQTNSDSSLMTECIVRYRNDGNSSLRGGSLGSHAIEFVGDNGREGVFLSSGDNSASVIDC